MGKSEEGYLPPQVGSAIRQNRLRAGLTQVQLAGVISRSGKFLSEVENGKARVTRRDLQRLASAMGVSEEAIREIEQANDSAWRWGAPRRIREVQPTGMTILSFEQLTNHLDRSGWLRSAKLWTIGAEPFPEENDLALVEQISSLVAGKDVSLRYVYRSERLNDQERTQLDRTQGTLDALPTSLLAALRWSMAMRKHIDPLSNRIVGYAVDSRLPALCECHTVLWVETADASWSDVMPLLYCRAATRTFENPSDSTSFWYHVPRDRGSRLLLDLAQQLEAIHPQAVIS
ncbi:MAG: helix-turn-helix transcriptional regulator [Acidobacteria bacterium]|nr:helix-turn-helix transcriptional regulator [Acidobacteriota bacterium]